MAASGLASVALTTSVDGGQGGPRRWARWRVSFRALGQGRISYAILIIADGAAMAIERGWLVLHQSGTYVKFTQEGADLFA